MARPKFSSEVGQLLRLGRNIKGWTLRELEKRTGLHNGLISQIETGHIKEPSFLTVVLLARALNVPVEHLADQITGKRKSAAGERGGA